MKVGDLVAVDYERGTIVGALMSFYERSLGEYTAKFANVYIIRTPDGEFVGEQYPFSTSAVRVVSESR